MEVQYSKPLFIRKDEGEHMSTGLEGSLWLVLSMSVPLIFVLITWLHLFRQRDHAQAYLGAPLLPKEESSQQASGLKLNAPRLYLSRILTLILIAALSSVTQCSPPETESNLVLTDGLLVPSELGLKGVMKVNADRDVGTRDSVGRIDLDRLSENKVIYQPRYLGISDPLTVINKALKVERHEKVIYHQSAPPLVRRLRSYWERSTDQSSSLHVEALIHQRRNEKDDRKKEINVLLERFIFDPKTLDRRKVESGKRIAHHPRGQWVSIGQLTPEGRDTHAMGNLWEWWTRLGVA